MLNKNLKIGRLTHDPDFHPEVGQSKTPLAKLSIAVNRNFGDQTDFFKVAVWGKQAEACAKYLKKGRPVYIEGRDEYREYTDNAGVKRTAHEIIAERVVFLPDRDRGETQEPAAAAAEGGQEAPF